MNNRIIIFSLIGVIIMAGAVSLFAFLSKNKAASSENRDHEAMEETIETITVPELPENAELNKYKKLDGSTVAIPLAKKIAETKSGASSDAVSQTVKFNTTHQAIMNLLNKEADVVMTTYPSQEELQEAQEKGIALEITPMIKDAFIFLVSTENPVKNLSSQQIRQIFSGSLTNWKAVGGADAAILPLQREKGSGSQTGMIAFMGNVKLAPPLNEHVYTEMDSLVSEIANVYTGKHTISYSYRYFVESMYVKDTVRVLSLDGIPPTQENIRNKRYPQIVSYYLITRKDDESAFAAELKDFVLSEEGQNLAQDLGYVKL